MAGDYRALTQSVFFFAEVLLHRAGQDKLPFLVAENPFIKLSLKVEEFEAKRD